jgi:hypothetical protein
MYSRRQPQGAVADVFSGPEQLAAVQQQVIHLGPSPLAGERENESEWLSCF